MMRVLKVICIAFEASLILLSGCISKLPTDAAPAVSGSDQNPIRKAMPVPDDERTISYKGVSFSIDASLAEGILMTEAKAVKPDSSTDRPDGIGPRHLSFRFPAASRHADSAFAPELNIYPVQEYLSVAQSVEGYRDIVDKQFDNLRTVLSEGSNTVRFAEYPFIPFVDASQILHSRVSRVRFINGSGISFLTQFRHSDPELVNNRALVLVFQGLTSDGRYLVSGTFPVTAAFLPDHPDGAEHLGYSIPEDFFTDSESSEKAYGGYLKAVESRLDQASEEEFSPRLSLFAKIFSSLRIEPDFQVR